MREALMPKLKITENSFAKLKAPDPRGKQTLHWDIELKGFAILCSGVSESKTYIVQRDVAAGRQRRLTVGDEDIAAQGGSKSRGGHVGRPTSRQRP
jgi:hypothetical protein